MSQRPNLVVCTPNIANQTAEESILSLLDELTLHPEKVESISTSISRVLVKVGDRASLVEAVGYILDHAIGFGPSRLPFYVLLFTPIIETVCFQTARGTPFRVKDALNANLAKLTLSDFQKKLPFMTEMFRLRLLPWTILLVHMSAASKATGDYSLIYQFEVLRCLSDLIDTGAVQINETTESKLNDPIWIESVNQLRQAIEKNVIKQTSVTNEMAKFLNHLVEKNRWQKAIDVKCLPTSSSVSNDQTSLLIDLTLDDDDVLPSPSTAQPQPQRGSLQQAFPLPPPISPTRSSNRALQQQLPPVPARLPSPFVTQLPSPQQTIPTQFSQGHEAQPLRALPPLLTPAQPPSQLRLQLNSQPPQPSPGVAARSLSQPPSQQTPQIYLPLSVKAIIEQLAKSPESLASATADVKIHFSRQVSARNFEAIVNEILDCTLRADLETAFTSCVKLIENLKSYSMSLPGTPGPGPTNISFRDMITKIVVKPHVLENKQQIGNFCACFRLTNELYRLELIPRNVFQFYIENMANNDSEASCNVMFEVLRNLDKLVDAKVANLSESEFAFWEDITSRLESALHRSIFDASLSGNVTAFLDALHEKGGLRRKVCTCCVPKAEAVDPPPEPVVEPVVQPVPSTAPRPSITSITSVVSVASTPQTPNVTFVPPVVPSVVPPSQTPRQIQAAVTSSATASYNTATEQHSPKTKQEDEFRTLISSITLNNNNTAGSEPSWLAALKRKLKSLPTPFAFMNAIELVAIKFFELIDDIPTTIDAANLCVNLSSGDYGRGRIFSTELEHFCLKYISGKVRADFEKVKRALEKDLANAHSPEEKKLLMDEKTALENLFRKRRIGCVRLIGRLLLMKHFGFTFVASVADALLSMATEQSLECLLEFFADVGPVLPFLVREHKMESWWDAFFSELASFERQPKSSDHLKQLVKDIFLEKNTWPEVDEQGQTRKTLEKLVSGLSSGLMKTGGYEAAVENIRSIIAQECPDEHVQQMFAIFQKKIDKCIACFARTSTPRPSSVSKPPSVINNKQQLPKVKPTPGPPPVINTNLPSTSGTILLAPPSALNNVCRSFREGGHSVRRSRRSRKRAFQEDTPNPAHQLVSKNAKQT